MATRAYNAVTRTAATGTAAEQAAVALQRLRNFEIVNRWNGASIADDSNTILGTASNEVTLSASNQRDIDTAGVYAVIGRSIETNSDGRVELGADGVHIQWFNCNIRYTAGEGTAALVFNRGTDRIDNSVHDVRIETGQASTATHSFYGCTFVIEQGAVYVAPGDMFNCTMTYESGTTCVPSLILGTRMIGVDVFNFNGTTGFNPTAFEVYGIPDLFESVTIARTAFELTGQGANDTDAGTNPGDGAVLFIEPSFQDLTQNQRYRLQTTVQGDANMQNIGPQTHFANTRTNAIGNGTNFYMNHQGNTAGAGVLNYYGWRPSFFQDINRTIPIENVRVRITTNVTTSTTGLNATVATGQDGYFTSSGGLDADIDRTGLATTYINDFLTDNTGFLVSGANTRSSSDGGLTFNDGQWFDPLRFGFVDAPTGNVIHRNFSNNNAPDNTVIGLLTDLRGVNFTNYTTTFEARSYTHDVNVDVETQNGLVGTDAGNQPANSSVPINRAAYVGVVRPNIRAATEADAVATFATPTSTPRSPQEISDFLVAAFANYMHVDDLNLTGLQGNMATFDMSIFFVATTASAEPFDNLSISGNVITLTGIDSVVASNEGDPIQGLRTTGSFSFTGDVSSTGVNYFAGEQIAFDSGETYEGSFTAGGDVAASGSTFLANTTLTSGGTITGNAATVLTDGMTIDGDTENIGLNQFDGITINGDHTISTTETGTFTINNANINGLITVENTSGGTILLNVPTAQMDPMSPNRWVAGNGVQLAASDTTRVTFRPDSYDVAGRMALYREVAEAPGTPTTFTASNIDSVEVIDGGSRATITFADGITHTGEVGGTVGFDNNFDTSNTATQAALRFIFRNRTYPISEVNGQVITIDEMTATGNIASSPVTAGTATVTTRTVPAFTERFGNVVNVTAGGSQVIEVLADDPVANSAFLAVWRPFNDTMSTYTTRVDYTSAFPATSRTIELVSMPINEILLASARGVRVPSGADIAWSIEMIRGRNELVGRISGTEIGSALDSRDIGSRLTAAETQVLLLRAYSSPFYFDIIDEYIRSMELVDTFDFITPFAFDDTRADGDYLELNTLANNIEQQRITQLQQNDVGAESFTPDLTATVMTSGSASDTVTFPAVDIAGNPAGLTVDQVRQALQDNFNAILTRAQVRQDLANQANTGQVFTSDGSVVPVDTTPED